MNSKYVFFNDKIIKLEDAKVSVATHALQYGTGVFEGIRAYYSEKEDALFVFRMEDHYKRLLDSCKILMIKLGLNVEQLSQKTIELLHKNYARKDIYIRPYAYKSSTKISLNLYDLEDSLIIYTAELGRYLETAKGIRVCFSSWRRVSDNSIPPRGKIAGSYVNASLTKTESVLAGYDEALVLDENNHVVEGSAENIFLFKNGQIFTPPVSDDILVGITRDTILTILKNELGQEVFERSIDRSEVYQADEVFLVGTGAEVTPVIEVEGRVIGDGKVGKLTKKVQDIYYKLVHGQYPKYKNWLTKIKKG